MTAYCACTWSPAGASCSCPTGETFARPLQVLDLPRADLEQLTTMTTEIGDARSRGDAAEAARLKAERDEFQRDALARFQTALGGRKDSDMREMRYDDPRTDADDALDEDAASRRALRRQTVRDAISMGLDGEAAGREFDRDAAHFDAQDAAVRRNGVRRLAASDRDDDGGAW